MALWSCICELRAASGKPEDGLCLPWVHLAYQHFRTRLHNFSRMLTSHPQVLQSLAKAAQQHDVAGSEMVRLLGRPGPGLFPRSRPDPSGVWELQPKKRVGGGPGPCGVT